MNLLISLPMSLMGFLAMAGALAGNEPPPKPATKQEAHKTALPRAVAFAAVATPAIAAE